MSRRLAALGALALVIAAACGGGTDSVTTGDDVAVGGDGGSPIVIAEIDFARDRIVLRNAGDAAYDLTGHWVCNRPNYAELPAESLAPGATIDIPASSVRLDGSSGELGVYTGREFDNPAAIVRYVAWGAPGQGRQATAAAAGIWGAGDFVANDGGPLVSRGDNPVSSTDW